MKIKICFVCIKQFVKTNLTAHLKCVFVSEVSMFGDLLMQSACWGRKQKSDSKECEEIITVRNNCGFSIWISYLPHILHHLESPLHFRDVILIFLLSSILSEWQEFSIVKYFWLNLPYCKTCGNTSVEICK